MQVVPFSELNDPAADQMPPTREAGNRFHLRKRRNTSSVLASG